MFVAPPEVFSLLIMFHSPELTIAPVLILQIEAVSSIFLVVPRMIVAVLSIVVPFLVMVSVVIPRRHWCNERSA
jgi:hypothetical protein